jgi:16S rRNA (guanine527-N7)-methyltransferase
LSPEPTPPPGDRPADGADDVGREPDEPAERASRRLFGERAELGLAYARRLATTGVEWGLIGPQEVDRLWRRHLANSAALAPLVPDGAVVCDIGSGAGLPGLPLALARPEVTVRLVEPLLRRSRFLEAVVAELGLAPQVTVWRGRAEDLDSAAEVVTARAVAPLGRLVGWTKHLFPHGQLLALKGERAAAELAAARPQLDRWGLRAEILTLDQATVVRVWPARLALAVVP